MLRLKLISAAFQLPHPYKRETGTEDAYFISPNNLTVGVADGVGGWAEHFGANSALWSHKLMNLSCEYSDLPSPIEIFKAAFNDFHETIHGSTTISIAKLENDTMIFYNLGDSGCAIFKNYEMKFRTNFTVHSFNFPYQIGSNNDSQIENGTIEEYKVDVNDTMVCASDGLWDNLYPEEIGQILKKASINVTSPETFAHIAARNLVRSAFTRGSAHSIQTPFSDAAEKASIDYLGGKLDDTTVVISFIAQDE
ncbi:expressed protein, putative [Trichomonas vaginalis G3]|uniref:Protein phosphatase n=1 Tax=Trichomonas vaginalis (strain ATCC PRA-98 / G3) TaxID=412133 RepID=A2FKA0_TRIV3|nr:phosphoprotein phosphatase protein [Trichomonas vaginalis G3]EAX94677.1 expressed protein, putative [Trichomonas vaginalis G3]KAI5510191.1 phosphoprotein phosphatase protein [Trichomonas vaginalis G3]|eukprot:XP_001307607.1 expressed protein [Trichomonas vaginalis G3]